MAPDKVVFGKIGAISGQSEWRILAELRVLRRVLRGLRRGFLVIRTERERSRCCRGELEIGIAQAPYPVSRAMSTEG